MNGWIYNSDKETELLLELNSLNASVDAIVIGSKYFLHTQIPAEKYTVFDKLVNAKPLEITIEDRQAIYNFWYPFNGDSVLWYNNIKTYHPLYFLLFPEHHIDEELEKGIRDFFLQRTNQVMPEGDVLYPPLTMDISCNVIPQSSESTILFISQNLRLLKENPYNILNLDFVLIIMSVFPNLFDQWDINFYSSVSVPSRGRLTVKQMQQLLRINNQIYSFFYRKALSA